MRKRGYVANWQNRRWAGLNNGYQSGQNNPNIPPGSTGQLPNYLILEIRGRGYDYYYDGEEQIRYLKEVIYVSPVFTSISGDNYRFGVLYTRANEDSISCNGQFVLIPCSGTGSALSTISGDTEWDSGVASSGRGILSYLLFSWAEAKNWTVVTTNTPALTTDAYNMMNDHANDLYQDVMSSEATGMISTVLSNITVLDKRLWGSPPLEFTEQSEQVAQIIARAKSLSNVKYWYGGNGAPGTVAMANSLKATYPSIWTDSYYRKALADVGQPVGDCSYLVNYAYGKASPGNHGPSTGEYLGLYARWSGVPKDGMIAWRNGHTGIYFQGKTLELVGINYDYQEYAYDPSKWDAILYNPNIKY